MKSKQCLDVQQMQHLQELGMKLDYDTLFRYIKFEDTDWLLKPFSDLNIIGINFKYIPAYTLQDVLDALPTTILQDKRIYELDINMCNESIEYVKTSVDDVLVGLHFTQLQLIDAAYSMLCWCIENKFVETNKNE